MRRAQSTTGLCPVHWIDWKRKTEGRRYAAYDKVCGWCESEFTTHVKRTTCCSVTCGVRLNAGWSRSTEIVHVPAEPKPRRVHPSDMPPPKRTDWWQLLVSGPCRRCGEDFTALAASVGTAAAYC